MKVLRKYRVLIGLGVLGACILVLGLVLVLGTIRERRERFNLDILSQARIHGEVLWWTETSTGWIYGVCHDQLGRVSRLYFNWSDDGYTTTEETDNDLICGERARFWQAYDSAVGVPGEYPRKERAVRAMSELRLTLKSR